MKRLFISILVLLLGTVVLAQSSALPEEDRFDATVSIQAAEGLYSTIDALARSVGLTPVLHNVPDTLVEYNITDGQPFRLIWRTILELNQLGFLLRGDDLVIVAPLSEIDRLRDLDVAAINAAGTPESGDAVQEFYTVSSDLEDLATILTSSIPGITVQLLPKVQTLLVSGTAEQHVQVRALLDRFDIAVEQVVVEIRTHRLANAAAEDLATTLSSIRSALGVPEEGEQASDLFTVTADARTNSIIVAAPREVQEQIASMLPELDVRQEQVNVQVRIQEIQTRAANRLGINLGGSLGQLSANILNGGLSFIFDPHAAVSAFNLGAVLDTLESQGLSRRVDDSSLTVLNNARTSIQAGGTILISIPGASENIERTIPYGVQIDVVPRVASDGRITLVIEAKVEDVLSSIDNPQLLELSTRAVNSTITLDPGQTVLLSGLMQNQFIEEVNRVPVLGNLPVIGALFRSTVTEVSDTELLIIVTADVLD